MPEQFFSRLVPLLGGVLCNVPEVLLESHAAKPERIVYHYTISGGITVLFIEVKLSLNHRHDRLDQYAQAIAESIRMSATKTSEVPLLMHICSLLFCKL